MDSPRRQLLLLKRAMSQVSWEGQRRRPLLPPRSATEKLGVAIRCLRAAEQGWRLGVQRALEEMPELHQTTSADELCEGACAGRRRLQDAILHWARDDVREELEALRAELPSLSDAAAAARREPMASKLRRL